MTTFTIDLVYSRESGSVQLLLDWSDPSLTTRDIEEGLQDGTLRETVLEQVRGTLGDDLAQQLSAGLVPMICAETDRGARRDVDSVLRELPLASTSAHRSRGRSINQGEVQSRESHTLENDA